MRSDAELLEEALRHGRALIDYLRSEGKSAEDIETDMVLQWTVTTPLYNVGECVYHVSDATKSSHPEIPWFRVSGMRHRLVHDYRGTNWSIVAKTITEDLPEFLDRIDALLGTLGSTG